MLLKTAGKLYVFGDNFKPKFFVSMMPDLGSSASPALDPRILLYCETGPLKTYDYYHTRIHELLGTLLLGSPGQGGCRRNEKKRRNGNDSAFSDLIRNGADDRGGCYNTPFMDIDAVETDGGGKITGVVEYKNHGEQMGKFQEEMLHQFQVQGLTVRGLNR